MRRGRRGRTRPGGRGAASSSRAVSPQPPLQPGQPFKFSVLEICDRIKEEFQFLQAQYHRWGGGRWGPGWAAGRGVMGQVGLEQGGKWGRRRWRKGAWGRESVQRKGRGVWAEGQRETISWGGRS